MTDGGAPLHEIGPELGTAIIAAMKRAGVGFVLSVPDIVTSQHLLWPIAKDPDFRLIRVCKEDEAFGIAAGLSFCNQRAVLLIQQTGLLGSLNALRAVGVELEMPICALVGLQGRETDVEPGASTAYGVRIVAPILEAMGVEQRLVQTPGEAATISGTIDEAYRQSRPAVVLL
jgi:sulfopyruvate decarboxylase TPP-binding subunit